MKEAHYKVGVCQADVHFACKGYSVFSFSRYLSFPDSVFAVLIDPIVAVSCARARCLEFYSVCRGVRDSYLLSILRDPFYRDHYGRVGSPLEVEEWLFHVDMDKG